MRRSHLGIRTLAQDKCWQTSCSYALELNAADAPRRQGLGDAKGKCHREGSVQVGFNDRLIGCRLDGSLTSSRPTAAPEAPRCV